MIRWQHRAQHARLDDARPGPEEAVHALLGPEREAIITIAETWVDIDRSHRKLAHRGSRLEAFDASESTVLRVLREAGLRLPGPAAQEPLESRAWPEWAELVPG